MDFGKAIKEAREQKHMTQEQLAQQMYVTKRAVSKWECGRTTPDLEKAYQLLEILDIRASFEEILYPHSHEMYAVPVDKTFCNLPDIKALCADKGKYPTEIRLSKPAYLLFKHLKSWNPDYQISDLYRSFLLPHTKANPEKKQTTYSIEFNGDDFMKYRRNNGTSYGQNDALTVSDSGAGKTRFSKQSAKKNQRIIGNGWRIVIHPSEESGKGINAEQKDVFLFPNGHLSNGEYKIVEANEKTCPIIWSQNVRGGGDENVIVIGGPGTGKSRYFIKPNLLQMDGSYVIMDVYGEYLSDTGMMFEKNGYKIKVVNLMDVDHSYHYDPIHYCRSEYDVVRLADCIIANTPCFPGSPEDVKVEKILISAYIFYFMGDFSDGDKKDYSTLYQMICRAGESDKDEEILHDLFMNLPEGSKALEYYNIFMRYSPFSRNHAFLSCSLRLKVFASKSTKKLLRADDLELEKIGEEKTALFIIADTDHAQYEDKCLIAMLYHQIFDTLYNVIQDRANHNISMPVHCVMDEFGNSGVIPDFAQTLARMRMYNISVFMVLQDFSQLKALYGENSMTIAALCGAIVFMGSQEWETLKWISSLRSCSQLNFNNLASLPSDVCIIIPRSENVITSKKFSLTSHPNYYLTAEADIANLYQFDN